MMTRKLRSFPLWLFVLAAIASVSSVRPACAQKEPAQSPPEMNAPPAKASPAIPAASAASSDSTPAPDRALAYYHMALASNYEEQAVSEGRPELVGRAIEEYKLALNADPDSPQLNIALADLYFRTGHPHEAENTARQLLKAAPENADAHKLLGRIYLRTLSENQGATTPQTDTTLDLAIVEFEKIIALQPKDVESHMILGQLYNVKHDAKRAEEQFKLALGLDPDAEEVILNLARLYAENGNVDQEIKLIEAIPVADRTAKMEDVLGSAYEEAKRTKDAIAAYQRAADMEPGDMRTLDALAQALLSNNQLDEALKQYRQLSEADPENAEALVHISEIQRRQGKYEEALATIRKARKIAPENLEAGYNEGLLLDVLGHYDEAVTVYEKMVDATSHANGAYTNEEKANRGIFLERLGAVYHEQNKTAESIATYQKMIDLGGETGEHGYQAEVDVYRDARQFDKAIEVAKKAVEANPKDTDLKLMLAGEMGDLGKTDEGLALAKGMLVNKPEDRTVWIAIGQMCVRARRWKEADDAFNKAEELTKKKEDRLYLFFLRGESAERQKHIDTAEQFFRQALELDPESAMTLNYLGYMLADKGMRLPEALKMIRKAVELEPMNGAYLDSLGWVYFKMGDYERAEENLRQAVERDQSDPTVHDHLGDLYEKTGRIRLAAAQWTQSLAQFAKSAQTDVEPAEVAKVQKKLDSARVKLAKQENATGPAKPE